MDNLTLTNDSNTYTNDNIYNGIETFSKLFQPENLRHSWPWIAFFTVLHAIIFVIGIVGNFLVILVYFRNSKMRTVRNLFIMNLAVADLFVILFCIPGNLVANTFVSWILGTFMCKGLSYVQGVSVFASAYFLAAISADRCKAFYRPMQIAQGLSKYQAVATITAIWIASLLLLIPWAVVFEVVPAYENDINLHCIETWENDKHGDHYFLFGNFICCYLIPTVLICVCNFHLLCIVHRREVDIDSASSSITVESLQKKQNTNVTKTLFLLTFTFILSWLPLYAIICRLKFSSVESISENEHHILSVSIPFVQLLGTSNSCINPVFYAFLNSKFRDMLQPVFKTKCNCTCNKNLSCFRRERRYQSKRKIVGGPCPKHKSTRTIQISRDVQSESSSFDSIRPVWECQQETSQMKYHKCGLKRKAIHIQTYFEVCENGSSSKIKQGSEEFVNPK